MEFGVAALAANTATVAPCGPLASELGLCERAGKPGKYGRDGRAQPGAIAARKIKVWKAHCKRSVLIQRIALCIAQQAGQCDFNILIVLNDTGTLDDDGGTVLAHKHLIR